MKFLFLFLDFFSIFKKFPKNIDYLFLKSLPVIFYPKALRLLYDKNKGKKLCLFFPQTFNDYINHLKLFDSVPLSLKTQLTDKIEVRKYVENIIGDKYFKKIYAVYNSFDEINIEDIPIPFFLKTNHGCKWQVLIENREYFQNNYLSLKKNFNSWLRINYAYANGLELQYRDIKPKIFAEEYLQHDSSNFMLPADVEFFCFGGEPRVISVREIYKDEKHISTLFDSDGNVLPYSFNIPSSMRLKRNAELPKYYDEMYDLAKKLSSGFNLVRVDFLHTGSHFYFNELTFTPFSGYADMPDPDFDKYLSKYFKY